MLSKDGTIIIFFLVARRIDGEAFGCMCHLLVAYLIGGDLLERVYPGISHSVRELLLLSPCNSFWQVVGKCLTHNLLLNGLSRTHLGLGIGSHGDIEKLLVEEWHSTLNTPS